MRSRAFLVVAIGLLGAFGACRRGEHKPSSGVAALGSALASNSATATPPQELASARAAADRRESTGIPALLATSPDVTARRASARALAEVADANAIERLGHALSDEDFEVVAWAAYGVALPCDVDPELPRDDRARIVRALSARAVTLEHAFAMPSPIDPWSAIAWGLGRCGGPEASKELARWLRASAARARFASWSLGAIAQRDRGLEDDVAAALVEAARATPSIEEALYPFGRGDWGARPATPGLADVARKLLRSSSETTRLFAIRALGRGDAGKPEDLRAVLADEHASANEQVEAMRALHRLGAAGDAEIAAFATRHAPTDEAKTTALLGAGFGALHVALELLGERAQTKTITTSMRAFLPVAFAPIAASTKPTVARRLSTLRCLSAVVLHPSSPGDSEIVRCAAYDPSLPAPLRASLDAIRDDARLDALDRSDVTGDRRDLALRLAKEGALRVRERALTILAHHPETEESPEILARSLSAKELGVVASAAMAIAERPSMADGGISKSAIKDALDPKIAAPTIAPLSKETDPAVKKALDGALARPMLESDAEVKIDLASAIGALKYGKGRAFLMRLCEDRGPALRRAARAALDRLDPPGTAHPCATIADFGASSPLSTTPLLGKTIQLETDVGALKLLLDPTVAPIAVARIVELVSSGFYDGIVIHRVVPGFVVQFGDRLADGFGGSDVALRDETSPLPFEPLSIGIALAGRDTGSSQLFVTLARTPHLDGSYTLLGQAEGAWSSLAEGDSIVKASVLP